MAEVFFSYSHADEDLRDQLEKQLAMLLRQGAISVWHDRRIGVGQELHTEIDQHLQKADVILLLISSDFLASDYCYEREMLRAIERHEDGSAIVIPVILRACDWQSAPFGRLLATPRDGRPITLWPDRDQAFLDVTSAIKGALQRLGQLAAKFKEPSEIAYPAPATISVAPRSSNLRMAKAFTERDKDTFMHEGFEYIAKYFENSLSELQARNKGVEVNFRRISANRFTSAVYEGGAAKSRCTIFIGGHHYGGDIAYSASETDQSNSYNECLQIGFDEHAMFFQPIGMPFTGAEREAKLTMEGAAELFWSMLIGPLQR